VAISSSQKSVSVFRHIPIRQTGALAAVESGLRLLAQAAIEKPMFESGGARSAGGGAKPVKIAWPLSVAAL
jgi:hypothetical protein